MKLKPYDVIQKSKKFKKCVNIKPQISIQYRDTTLTQCIRHQCCGEWWLVSVVSTVKCIGDIFTKLLIIIIKTLIHNNIMYLKLRICKCVTTKYSYVLLN